MTKNKPEAIAELLAEARTKKKQLAMWDFAGKDELEVMRHSVRYQYWGNKVSELERLLREAVEEEFEELIGETK